MKNTESYQVYTGNTKEAGNRNINEIPVKTELETETKTETEAAHSVHQLRGNALEVTFNVQNYNSASDGDGGDLAASIVQSELVEFHNSNQSSGDFIQNNNEADDLYNNADSHHDANCDPNSERERERDPCADSDCDASFSKKTYQSHYPNDSSTQIQLVNGNAADLNYTSSNLPTSSKSISPTANTPKHTRYRKTLSSKLQQCGLCLQLQNSESKLKTHMEICVAFHKDRRRFCVQCNVVFSSPQGDRKQAHRAHGIQKAVASRFQFKCKLYPSPFPQQGSLIAHATSCHHETNRNDTSDQDSKEKPFKCPMTNCGKAFKLNHNLKDHLCCVHSEERPFECQEPNCDKTFKTNAKLHRHMVSHSVDRPFKCPHNDCYRMFPNIDKATRHMVVHAKGTFQCLEPNCDLKFTFKHNLKSHIAYLHTKKEKNFHSSVRSQTAGKGLNIK